MTETFWDKLKRGHIDIEKFLWVPKRKKPPLSPYGFPYANFHRRMTAAMLDSLLLIFILAPVTNWLVEAIYGPLPVDWRALQEAVQSQATVEAQQQLRTSMLAEAGYFERWKANFILQCAGLVIYTFCCWCVWSATPGKIVMRIRIIDAKSGAPISRLQAFLRIGGYMFSAIPLLAGFFWIAFDKKHQGWHDKFAGTYVVSLPWRKKKEEVEAAPEIVES